MKPQTQTCLRMLREAGDLGVTTHDFAAAYIARFGARLNELRLMGCDIETERIGANQSRYTLTFLPPDLELGGDPPAAPHPPQPCSPRVAADPEAAETLFPLVDLDIPKPPALLDPDSEAA